MYDFYEERFRTWPFGSLEKVVLENEQLNTHALFLRRNTRWLYVTCLMSDSVSGLNEQLEEINEF